MIGVRAAWRGAAVGLGALAATWAAMVGGWAAAAPLAEKADTVPAESLERVVIPQGIFVMGHPKEPMGDWMADETPQRVVTLDAYAIQTHEVTVGQWVDFLNKVGGRMAWHPLQAVSAEAGVFYAAVDEDVAVGAVSWFEARAFCRWHGGDLPTEAQWERAAFGTAGLPVAKGEPPRLFSWGDEQPHCAIANVSDAGTRCYDSPVSVEGPPGWATSDGVQRLHGNVKEWIRDWYGPYGVDNASNPVGPPEGRFRVVRGGSFLSSPERARTTARSSAPPASRSRDHGFRCVWEVQ